ncbi:nucleolar protein family member 3, putative [Ichthyophthirius multifiliis]|uniref:Nucleolar protein 10 n=1 Tax=Ichthyophthirius multifiliis TaxID=5932 RepID=G0QZ68_ICHMU|nr:nucleolar protein family member 3, putative [Ichthyophthirius multifiliis]EGR29491.1 nucleolar protein family member 3, putative [Ichthyophthirius multifiliis]|eukprot:XP_004030727.1 nucleolar protein family member 3, putative [Ichthyophthirius multifiliis]
MHLRYYLNEKGERVYTLSSINNQGVQTLNAHPARFSPDDPYSKERYEQPQMNQSYFNYVNNNIHSQFDPYLDRSRQNSIENFNQQNTRKKQIKTQCDARQRVANSRLRIKGRFVTKSQALIVLGIEKNNDLSQEQLKYRLIIAQYKIIIMYKIYEQPFYIENFF